MHINKELINKLTSQLSAGWKTGRAITKIKAPARSKIDAFPGEIELLRRPTVLVTDTRLAYIDPYDRKLKTYMFEHMISVNKEYYTPTNFIRGFCKALIVVGVLLVLITVIVDLLDNNSRGFVLVYIPALLSLIVGLLVWRDMRPKYKVEWKMRDGSTDKIATELLFGAWLMNDKNRENGMNDLTRAMNEALARKAWWPGNNAKTSPSTEREQLDLAPRMKEKPPLMLVTDNYE